MGKGNLGAPLVGLHIGAATVDDNMQTPQKPETRTTTRPSNSTSGYLSEQNKK